MTFPFNPFTQSVGAPTNWFGTTPFNGFNGQNGFGSFGGSPFTGGFGPFSGTTFNANIPGSNWFGAHPFANTSNWNGFNGFGIPFGSFPGGFPFNGINSNSFYGFSGNPTPGFNNAHWNSISPISPIGPISPISPIGTAWSTPFGGQNTGVFGQFPFGYSPFFYSPAFTGPFAFTPWNTFNTGNSVGNTGTGTAGVNTTTKTESVQQTIPFGFQGFPFGFVSPIANNTNPQTQAA